MRIVLARGRMVTSGERGVNRPGSDIPDTLHTRSGGAMTVKTENAARPWQAQGAVAAAGAGVRRMAHSGAAVMTTAQPEGLGSGGVRSLEVRWIFPGQLAPATAGWFGRFPAETTALDDEYLLEPHLPGLSVKIRAGRALEVKAYGGSPGLFEMTGRARGRLESWRKWSFPCDQPSQGAGDIASWRLVSKRRRISWFSLVDGSARASVPGLGERPHCAVELTEFRTGGEDWWTLGFEATGPVSLLRSELQAAATLVFAQALPGRAELDMGDSRSYPQWLRRRQGAESDAHA